jgi:hypothetical protein
MTRSWLFIITPSARLSPLTAGTNARIHQLYPSGAKLFVGFRLNVRIVYLSTYFSQCFKNENRCWGPETRLQSGESHDKLIQLKS